jgi:hypothetical protein
MSAIVPVIRIFAVLRLRDHLEILVVAEALPYQELPEEAELPEEVCQLVQVEAGMCFDTLRTACPRIL